MQFINSFTIPLLPLRQQSTVTVNEIHIVGAEQPKLTFQ